MEKELLIRLQQLEQKHRKLKFAFITCLGFAFIGIAGLSFKKEDKFDIIRAKGIVIEDSLGKDRILIGAPIPFSKDRVRTDTALVRKYWSAKMYKKNPDQYMKWYRNYVHSAVGVVVMNENGFDRVQFGEKLSDPNVGHRIFEFSGISWNDSMGLELGGAGVNSSADGKARAVVGLDDSEGEAVHLMASDNNTKGLFIKGKHGELMIGMAKPDTQFFKSKENFTGVKYFDKTGKLVWEQQMMKPDSMTKKNR
jgi:hypothetical protein